MSDISSQEIHRERSTFITFGGCLVTEQPNRLINVTPC